MAGSTEYGIKFNLQSTGGPKLYSQVTSVARSFGELNREAKGVSQATSNQTKEFAKMSQGLGGMVHIYATVAANLFAVSAAFQALKQAAQVTQLFSAMNALSIETGRNMSALARDIRDLTDSALSLEAAMRVAAQGATAGFGPETLARITTIAKGASKALGRSMPDSIDRLTRGIIKIEPELLDELGIMVRVNDAVRDYAREVGKSVSALTGWEKRQAFANAVLKEGEEKFGDLADAAEANPYDKLAAGLQNFLTKNLGNIANKIAPFFQVVIDNITTLFSAAAFLLAGLLKSAIPNFSGWANNAIATAEIIEQQAAETEAKFIAADRETFLREDAAYSKRIKATNDYTATVLKNIGIRNAALQESFAKTGVSIGNLDLFKDLDDEEFINVRPEMQEGITKGLKEANKERAKIFKLGKETGKLDVKKLHNINQQKLGLQKLQSHMNNLAAAETRQAEDIARGNLKYTQKVKLKGHSLGLEAASQKELAKIAKMEAEIIRNAAAVDWHWKSIYNTVKDTKNEAKELGRTHTNLLREQGASFAKVRGIYRQSSVFVKGVTSTVSKLSSMLLGVVTKLGMLGMVVGLVFSAFKKIGDAYKGEELVEALKKAEEAQKRFTESIELSSEQYEKFITLIKKGQIAKALTQDISRTEEVTNSFEAVLESLTSVDFLEKKQKGFISRTWDWISSAVESLRGRDNKPWQSVVFDWLLIERTNPAFQKVSDNIREGIVSSLNEAFKGKPAKEVQKAIDQLINSGAADKMGIGIIPDKLEFELLENASAKAANEYKSVWIKSVSGVDGIMSNVLNNTAKNVLTLKDSFTELGKLVNQEFLDVVPDTGIYRITQELLKLSKAFENIEDTIDGASIARGLLTFEASSDATHRSTEEFRNLHNEMNSWYEDYLNINPSDKDIFGKNFEEFLRFASDSTNTLPVKMEEGLASYYERMGEATEKALIVNKQLLRDSIELAAQEKRLAYYTDVYSKANAEAYKTVRLLKVEEFERNKLVLSGLEEKLQQNRRQLQDLNALKKKDGKLSKPDSIQRLVLIASIAKLNEEVRLTNLDTAMIKKEIVELGNMEHKTLRQMTEELSKGKILSEDILKAYKQRVAVALKESKLQQDIANSYEGITEALIKLRQAAGGGSILGSKTSGEVQLTTAKKINDLRLETSRKDSAISMRIIESRQELERMAQAGQIKEANHADIRAHAVDIQRALYEKNAIDIDRKNKQEKLMLEQAGALIEAEKANIRERNTWLANFKSYHEFNAAVGEQIRLRARDDMQKMATDVDNMADTMYGAVTSGANSFIDELVAGQNSLETLFENVGKAMLESMKEDLTKMAKDMLIRSFDQLLLKGKGENAAITSKEKEAQALYEDKVGKVADQDATAALKLGMEQQHVALYRINETLSSVLGPKLDAIRATIEGTYVAPEVPEEGRIEIPGGVTGKSPMGVDDDILEGSVLEETKGMGNFFKENVGVATGLMTVAIGAATESQTTMWMGVIQIFTQLLYTMIATSFAAKGGIMTSHGLAQGYAKGGVATSPQLAVFGEGRQNEAYVPLPDNRSIPVTLSGGEGGTNNISVAVNIDSNGGVDTSADGTGENAGKQLGMLVSAAVKNELVRQQSPGGILAGRRR